MREEKNFTSCISWFTILKPGIIQICILYFNSNPKSVQTISTAILSKPKRNGFHTGKKNKRVQSTNKCVMTEVQMKVSRQEIFGMWT